MPCQITTDHWCDTHRQATGAGAGPGFFCNSGHPGYTELREVNLSLASEDVDLGKARNQIIEVPTVHCRRRKGHDGDHSAFVFSIRTPETWTNFTEEPPF